MSPIITYKTLKFKRRFGIEIEINKSVPKPAIIKAIKEYSNYDVHSFNYGKSVNNKLWHVKSDITCGEDEEDLNGGWEVASFVGHSPQDIVHMGNVATALKEAGAKVNRFCGLHIHAEATDLLPYQVGIMLAYWIKFEHIMTYLVAPYRSFEHCTPLTTVMQSMEGQKFRSAFYDPEDIYNCFLPIDDIDDTDEDVIDPDPMDYRYRAINVINYHMAMHDKRRKRKTIELRMPESTLDSDNIIGWVRLYLNFIEHVKDAVMPGNLFSCNLRTALVYLGLGHDHDNFYLFGPSLNKTRVWLLERLLRNLHQCSQPHEVILRMEAKKLLKEVKI